MHAFRRTLLSACLFAISAQFAGVAASRDKDKASAADQEKVEAQALLQAENVRVDYAQVLNVEPVYETASARRSEVVCDAMKVKASKPATSAAATQGHWARFWGVVKGWFGSGRNEHAEDEPGANSTATATANKDKGAHAPRCRSLAEGGKARTPMAYDVDYVYRGMKFRARLPQDPGNRLRIRLSVMPYGVSSQALDSRD